MENCDAPGACADQKKTWAIITIIFYVLIICIVTLILFIYQFKDTIVKNIDKYRCRPYFMPFVSMFTDKSGADNFNECVFGTAKNYVDDYSKEINEMINEQQVKVNDSDLNVKNLDKNLSDWQEYLENMKGKKDAKENHMNLVLKYITIKIQHFFSKIVAGLLSFYYMLLSLFNISLAMIQIPLKVIPALFIIGASLAWAYPIPIIGQAIPIVIFGTATASVSYTHLTLPTILLV